MMEQFRTPIQVRSVSRLKKDLSGTPIRIPESPQMALLGRGTGVKVYSMERSSRTGSARSPWAVKRVNKQHMNDAIYQQRLSTEANILNDIHHPNIIGFRAYVKGNDGRACLAMEECETCLGDLIEDRAESCNTPFNHNAILKVALDIAKALDYLHTECHLLHGDLKSFNVLVKGNFEVAKLCDFGVCIPLDKNGVMIENVEGGYVGTEMWSAPEVLQEDELVTTKADIFPYGLILWEMLSLSAPHTQDLGDSVSSDEANAILDEVNEKVGTRPDLPNIALGEEYSPVLHVFNWCTESDPNKRPSARQIVDYLEGISKQK